MIKIKKLLLLPAVSLFTGIALVSCSNQETTTNVSLKSEANRDIALGNIKGTYNQLENVFTNIQKAVDDASKATDSNALTTNKSNLVTFAGKLNDLLTKVKTTKTKANALNKTNSDYSSKLEELKTELEKFVSELEKEFIASYKLVSPADATATDEALKAKFNDLKSLKSYFGNYAQVEIQGATLLDLARLFEAFQGGVGNLNRLVQLKTSDEEKYKEYVVVSSQVINLLLKRELQTVVMAMVLEKDIDSKKVNDSLAKLASKVQQREQYSKLPAEFITVKNSLKTKMGEFKAKLNDFNTKWEASKSTLTTQQEKATKVLTDSEKLVHSLLDGYPATETSVQDFVKPGFTKNTETLVTQLAEVPWFKLDSVQKFNNFFQKASPTWANSAGMFVNANSSNTLLGQEANSTNTTGSGLLDDMTKLVAELKSTNGASTNANTNALTTSLEELLALAKEVKTSTAKLATFANILDSAWKQNQNVRAVSSLAQLLLLQIAVDNLESVNAVDVALEDL